MNTIKKGSFEQNAYGEHALMIYDTLFSSYDVPTMKISLANGYAGRINQSYQFTWIYKVIFLFWAFTKMNFVMLLVAEALSLSLCSSI